MNATALVWIRRDLRLHDHAALAAATAEHERVAVVFVYDRLILDGLPDRDDKRLTFIHASLDEVDAGLRAQGSALLTVHGDPTEEIPALARRLGVEVVYTNHDDDPYALARDAEVSTTLLALGVGFRTFKDCVVFERREVLTQGGEPYKVFTPYSRAWWALLSARAMAEHTVTEGRFAPVAALEKGGVRVGNHTLEEIGFTRGELWLEPGTRGGQERLEQFADRMGRYEEERNFPALNSTSGLSVHLRHGTISVRECLRFAQRHDSPGAVKWTTELIWRDFYHMILSQFPHVVDTAFQPAYQDLEWPGSEAHFVAWATGQTGYPLVDAAMRCLNATGWMHNRLRMVVAMFLTKDLLVDWRLGETYFAQKLLDFELASNNGGWQWAASTGVDAQPYFRVFHPVTQSEKFDADGAFIREWVPELAGLTGKAVHWPAGAGAVELLAAGVELGVTYPRPIVDHAEMRVKAIELLGSVKGPRLPKGGQE